MLDFLAKHWSEILSVVGAAAWLPIVFKFISNHFRKISTTVLDSRILTNAFGVSTGRKERKNGTILLFVTNMFIKNTPFFAKDVSIDVKLKNGASLKTEILDFSGISSNNSDGTESTFDVEEEKEFNISRTIYADKDNIKYIAILVESADFSKLEEIDEINIKLCSSKILKKLFTKKITLKYENFPTFNSSHLIDNVEHIHAPKR